MHYAILLMVVLTLSCKKSTNSYLGFIGRDREFYADIAQACTKLLTETNRAASESIAGEDKSLPKVLLYLHATKIDVDRHHTFEAMHKPYVAIIFGVGRAGFTVNWFQNEYGNGYRPWELWINGDFQPTVLFSTTNKLMIPDVNMAFQH